MSSDVFPCVCPCCYNDVEENETISCINSHKTCKVCVTESLKASIAISGQVRCLDTEAECFAEYSAKELETHLENTQLVKRYFTVQSRKQVKCLYEDLFLTCYNCNDGVLLDSIAELNQILGFRCRECRKATCVRCGKAFHGPSQCKVTKEEIEELKESTKSVIFCKCGNKFVKDTSTADCNKLRCSVCSRAYCWICGIFVAEHVGYSHFQSNPNGTRNPYSSCPLYGGLPKPYKTRHIKIPKVEKIKKQSKWSKLVNKIFK